MKKLIYVILIIILTNVNLFGSEYTGSTSATFLKIPVGARIIGMGETTTALSIGPYALLGNIAGLVKNKDLEISFSHTEWIGSTDYEFIGFSKSFFKGINNKDSVIGFGINYLHLPFFNSYDDWGYVNDRVTFSDLALTLGYAQYVGELSIGDLNAGASVKYINESFNGSSDSALTFSLGFLYSIRIPTFTLFRKRIRNRILDVGLLMENWDLGTDISGHSTPVIYKLGIAFNPYESFLYSMDIHIPLDNRVRMNMGLEYVLNKIIFIRTGYRFFGYKVDTFSWGIGSKLMLNGKIIDADISYAPLSTLGNTLTVSLSLKYPGGLSESDRKLSNLLYYKGIYYYIHHEYDKAIELWEKCLKINPDFQKAKDKIKDAIKLKKLSTVEEKIPEKYRKK